MSQHSEQTLIESTKLMFMRPPQQQPYYTPTSTVDAWASPKIANIHKPYTGINWRHLHCVSKKHVTLFI